MEELNVFYQAVRKYIDFMFMRNSSKKNVGGYVKMRILSWSTAQSSPLPLPRVIIPLNTP
jgi:hypothetical protein